jgi:hypothetical protein
VSNPQTLVEHSVTRAEQEFLSQGAVTMRIFVGYATSGVSTLIRRLPELPELWSPERDRILSGTVLESKWAQAVGIAASKFVTKSFDVRGNVPERTLVRARKTIRGFDYIGRMQSFVLDYLLRDNGAFLEVIRQNGIPASRVLGLKYLDSARCIATGDVDIPVLYFDLLGRIHPLRYYQVLRVVDLQDGASPFGIGLCAARRAYNDIRNMAAIQQYKLEKETGSRPLQITFITGVSAQQLQKIKLSQREQSEAEGWVAMGGNVVVPFMQREGVEKVEIPIASLPDNFDFKTELDTTLNSYANALGIPVTDLMTIGGQAMGTGAQSQVIDDAQRGKGQAMLLKAVEQGFNNADLLKIMPTGVTFYFVENDIRDRKQLAEFMSAMISAATNAVGGELITAQQGLNWLVDNDVFPKEFLPKDETIGGSLSDTENVDPTALNILRESPQWALLQPALARPNGARATPQWDQPAQPNGGREPARWSAKAALDTVVKRFAASLEALVKKAWSAKARARKDVLVQDMNDLLAKALRESYVVGLVQGGLDEDDMEKADRDYIANVWRENRQHVPDFIEAVLAAKSEKEAQAKVIERVAVWGKTVRGMAVQALSNSKSYELVEWRLGATKEHCETCQWLHGQQHTRAWYARRGFYPGVIGSATVCGGWECKCVLQPVVRGPSRDVPNAPQPAAVAEGQ